MTEGTNTQWVAATRKIIFRAVALILGMGMVLAANAQAEQEATPIPPSWKTPQNPNGTEAFYGVHQSGIATPPQHHVYFAVFDLTTTKREDVIALLKAWTKAAERMSRGETAQPLEGGLQLAVPPVRKPVVNGAEEDDSYVDPSTRVADTGETTGMSSARLTVTFGFGADFFMKDGKDRYGLAAKRPAELVDMPVFPGDQIAAEHSGGALSIQACAEDPQVAFHAVRQLARIATGVAKLRWVQTGYRPSSGERHLLGFSDGIGNPNVDDQLEMNRSIWVGENGPDWMRGGTYMIVRRIRFALEHWDEMPQSYQEAALGRDKHPGQQIPETQVDTSISDENEKTHFHLVLPKSTFMLRRSYSYNNGVDFTVERWPPWRQGLEYNVGMLFICYQNNPSTAFIDMYGKMSRYDIKLNQFWTHEAGGIFAYPHGTKEGEYVGQQLFESR